MVSALLLVASVALASATIYTNDFSSKGEYREIKRVGGKAKRCDRSYRERGEKMQVAVRRGPEKCAYAPPVQGDGPRPDHDFRATGKILKGTPKSVRRSAYLFVAARSGGSGGYELKVFPKRGRFELIRTPSGGGSGFPAEGSSDAIKGIGERNKLRLRAFGARVKAFVNKTEVADVTDTNPNELEGTKLRFGVGHGESSSKDVLACFDDLTLAVPSP